MIVIEIGSMLVRPLLERVTWGSVKALEKLFPNPSGSYMGIYFLIIINLRLCMLNSSI